MRKMLCVAALEFYLQDSFRKLEELWRKSTATVAEYPNEAIIGTAFHASLVESQKQLLKRCRYLGTVNVDGVGELHQVSQSLYGVSNREVVWKLNMRVLDELRPILDARVWARKLPQVCTCHLFAKCATPCAV